MENKNLNSRNIRRNVGFTLVELLVAMSVFIIIFVGAIGTYLGALKNQRFLAELILINNNASLVMEQMAREMRTGYFDIGQQQGRGCFTSVSFTSGQEIVTGSQTPVTVTYALLGENITRTVGGNTTIMNSDGSTAVKNLCFEVIQDDTLGIRPECLAPRFVIRMEIKSKNLERENPAKSPSSFLQTTVSSRVLPREIQVGGESDPYGCREI